MTRTRQSLADIAKRAGVSIATVSRVLNDHPQVKAATRERVRRALAELRYDPNALFAPFVSTTSPMLGFLNPTSMLDLGLNRGYFLTQLAAIREEIESQGYGLFVGAFTGDPHNQVVGDRVLRNHQVKGAIVARVCTPEELEMLRETGLPVVLLNRPPGGLRIHSVRVDNRGAAQEAARYALSLGHQRIGVIGGPSHVYSAEERLLGYQDALREAGLPLSALSVARTNLSEAQGAAALSELLDTDHPPTAILAINDYLAIAAVAEAQRRGLRVPDDLSILGFGDVDIGRYISPPLTTIHTPWDRMGRFAARLLIESVNDPGLTHASVEMRTELIVRGSTAPPPRRAAAARRSPNGRDRREPSIAMPSTAITLAEDHVV